LTQVGVIIDLNGTGSKNGKKPNWLIFTLLFPFGYSYILLGELHRKLVTVLNWLIFTFKGTIREFRGK
jgi:hypothetical protein